MTIIRAIALAVAVAVAISIAALTVALTNGPPAAHAQIPRPATVMPFVPTETCVGDNPQVCYDGAGHVVSTAG